MLIIASMIVTAHYPPDRPQTKLEAGVYGYSDMRSNVISPLRKKSGRLRRYIERKKVETYDTTFLVAHLRYELSFGS